MMLLLRSRRLRRPLHRTRAAFVVGLVALGGLAPVDGPLRAADGDEAGRALLGFMAAELDRNLGVLGGETPPAYFMSYTVHDTHEHSIVASFGALHRSDGGHSRTATVQVRVGDYALDNTHPVRGGRFPSGLSRIAIPLTDEEAPIRLALWRATDRAFRQANGTYTRVKTEVAASIQDEEPVADFSRENAREFAEMPAGLTLDAARWESRLRRVSGAFAGRSHVLTSDVSLRADATNWYYANSEGSRLVTTTTGYRLFVQAATRADDGMELPLFRSYFARTPDGLPSEATLLEDAVAMADLLKQLREAPLVDPYSGPAILSGRAAGVFFHEIFGHRVEGHRQRNVDDGQTFAKQVEQQVLPPFLSVVFDPTRRTLGETELMGYYQYDDEGIEARPVTLVDRGILKTFLLDRRPLTTFAQSNGHGRAAPGYMPVSRQSNLLVRSHENLSFDALVERLKAEAREQRKPFGLIFDSIEGGFTNTGRGGPNAFNVLPNVVYRVFTDDRPPELVRGVDLIGTPLAAFAKIMASGGETEVFNGMCGAESGNVPVSAASPALLVGEVEVQKKTQSQEALPILSAPPLREGA